MKVRVPDAWVEDAEAMGISTSEYVRRKARRGRREWGDDPAVEDEQSLLDENTPQEGVEKAIKDAIVRNLAVREGIDQEELAELIFADVTDELSRYLQDLKEDGEIDYQPAAGGWVKNNGV